MFRTVTRTLATGAVALVAAAIFTACEPPPPTTCEGRTPTITGTSAGETINGTAGDDVILALAGNDTVNGLGGNDVICGDKGNDTLLGGAGNDTLAGGADFDTATYASLATGAVTADLAAGTASGDGNDALKQVEGVVGSNGPDTLTGDAAANHLAGGAGDDTFAGAGGNDTCVAGTGSDDGQSCETVTGTVSPATEVDTWGYGLAAGQLVFLNAAGECPGLDVLWSMTGPLSASFTARKVCNDAELRPTVAGNATVSVGGQGGTATGNYAFTLHIPVDATGTITAGGPAVSATNTVPGQNIRLAFSGVTGERISVRATGATYTDRYFVNLYRPNSSLLTYRSLGVGTGFVDTLALDATGTWTLEVNPNDDGTGTGSFRLYDVVDQTGTIAVGGSTVPVGITTPGQNASFSFAGTVGQRVTARLTGATFESGAVIYLYRPNGTYLTYGSGFGSATINGATLDAAGTWTLRVDPTQDGTGTATAELDPA